MDLRETFIQEFAFVSLSEGDDPHDLLVEFWKELWNQRRPLKSLISRALRGCYDTPNRPQKPSIEDTRGPVQSEWESVGTRLDEVESLQLAADYRDGMRITALARKYGVHRVTVREHLIKHGLAQPLNEFTEEKAEQAALLYQAGMTLVEVANEIGANTRSVTLALEARGIPRRPRGVRVAFDPTALEKLRA